jgi:hypothetical protein
MKKGKELKLNLFKNYNVVYGSVNNKNPKALYINISTWAEPKNNEDVNYSRISKDIHKNIRQTIYNYLDRGSQSLFLKNNTIVDFDIRESGIKYGKKSFANCEVTIYIKQELPINSEHIKPVIQGLIEVLITSIFEYNNHFNFYKTKK